MHANANVGLMNSADRRRTAVASVLLALSAVSAAAETFPEKPLRLLVPYTPGGAADVVSRAVAQRLTQRLGQPVVVENKPGDGGVLAMGILAKAPKDGYTFGLVANSYATIAILRPKLSFNPATELTPLAFVGTIPFILLTRTDAPFKTLQEFIGYAKQNPGKLSFASAGSGTMSHLLPTSFKKELGVALTHIPYGGAAPSLTSLMGGHVDLYLDPVATSADLVKTGKLRALAVTGGSRSKTLPNVPTLIEQGVAIRAVSWLGFVAPSGVPEAVLDKLNTEINAALQDEGLRRQFEAMEIEIDSGPPSKFTAFAAKEAEFWGQIIRENQIRAD